MAAAAPPAILRRHRRGSGGAVLFPRPGAKIWSRRAPGTPSLTCSMANQPAPPPGGPVTVPPYRDEIIISWPELHRDARYLSRVLHEMGDWKGIIAITRGGLVPAALVARELELRLIDTVCVVSYGQGERRARPTVAGRAALAQGGRGGRRGLAAHRRPGRHRPHRARRARAAPQGPLRHPLRQAGGAAAGRHLRQGVPAGEVDLLPLGHRLHASSRPIRQQRGEP